MTALQHLKDSLAVKVFLCLLILAPILIHLYYVCHYAVNIPLMDDYDAVLGFLNDFKKSGTADRVVLLFSQHNEHRILSSNLFYAAYYLSPAPSISGRSSWSILVSFCSSLASAPGSCAAPCTGIGYSPLPY